MGTATKQLCEAIQQTIELLGDDGRDWAAVLAEAKDQLTASDSAGLTTLRAMFRGMGSFSDLVLSRWRSAEWGSNDVIAANDRLDELRTSIYELMFKARADFPPVRQIGND
jgi:hypothetical protein